MKAAAYRMPAISSQNLQPKDISNPWAACLGVSLCTPNGSLPQPLLPNVKCVLDCIEIRRHMASVAPFPQNARLAAGSVSCVFLLRHADVSPKESGGM